jgi:hypothetical protein
MKLNAITILAVAGANVAHTTPITPEQPLTLTARSPLHKRDRYCKGFMASTRLETGWHVPKTADCEAIIANLQANPGKSWSLNVDTKERELAVHGTCAMSVWNPLEEAITVGEEDLIYVLETFTSSFSRRGYTKGNGTLFCHEDEEGGKKELLFKVDYPEGEDLKKEVAGNVGSFGDLKV